MAESKRKYDDAADDVCSEHDAKRALAVDDDDDDDDDSSEPTPAACDACDDDDDLTTDDITQVRDQTGRQWALCGDCATCRFCHEHVTEGKCAADAGDGVYNVIAGNDDGRPVFACGGDPYVGFDERAACGAHCDECGLVKSAQLAFHDLPCKRQLCVRHVDHRCAKCGPDATASISVYGELVDMDVCNDPPRFLDEERVHVALDNFRSLMDICGEDEHVMICFEDDSPWVRVHSIVGDRIERAADAREKAKCATAADGVDSCNGGAVGRRHLP